MRHLACAAAVAIGMAFVGGAANAMPLVQAPAGDSAIVHVAQGCGPGFHRTPYGRCVPNFAPRPFRRCPPGLRMDRFGRCVRF